MISGTTTRTLSGLCAGLLCAGLLAGCAEMGLVDSESVPKHGETGPDRPDSVSVNSFLILGDTQSSWRAEVKFYRRDNWFTWKQALIPFYQAYLIGNGIVGAVNWYRQMPDYGGRARSAVRSALHQEIRRPPAVPDKGVQSAPDRIYGRPAFLLHLGDIAAHDGRYPDHWEIFMDEYLRGKEAVLSNIDWAPVIGNHEYASDSTFGWPNYSTVVGEPRFYVVDTPDIAVFVLESNFLIDQHQFTDDDVQDMLFEKWFVSDDGSEESAWLERELARRADRPFKIVAMHHPLFSYAFHSRDWYKSSHGRNLIEKRDKLFELLTHHGVQTVLSGHEHLYERSRIRQEDGGELYQIISSGGGAAVRRRATDEEVRQLRAQYRSEGYEVVLDRQQSVYHFSRAFVEDAVLVIETVAVDDRDPESRRVIDRVELTNDH